MTWIADHIVMVDWLIDCGFVGPVDDVRRCKGFCEAQMKLEEYLQEKLERAEHEQRKLMILKLAEICGDRSGAQCNGCKDLPLGCVRNGGSK